MHQFELFHHKFRNPHYFEGKLSRGFRCLLISRIIANIASGFFVIFLPIFIYKILDNNFQKLSFYYLAGYLLGVIFVLILQKSLNKFGFRRALRMSALIGSAYYLAIFLLEKENAFFILPIMIFLISLWRFLYWVPYNIDFAKFTSEKERGKGVSFVEAMLSLVGVLTPVAAGIIIAKFGFNVLFLSGVAVFALSYIPLMRIPSTREKFSWDTKTLFKKLFKKKNRRLALFFFLDGAESILSIFVWPVFIFELLKGNYLSIGIISSMVVAVTVILQLLAGKFVDKKKEKAIRAGGFLYALGWLLKIFAATALHVFVFDAFHRFMKVFYRTPLDALVFETAFK